MTVILIFLAGIASILSPCVFPILPIFITVLAGNIDGNGSKKNIIINALAFSVGFTIMFITLGLSASLITKILVANINFLEKIVGVILIIFSIVNLNIIKLNLKSININISNYNASFIGSIFLGIAVSISWIPCTLPTLSSILAIAATNENIIKSIIYMLVYSLGFMVPFMIIAIFTEFINKKLNKINKYLYYSKLIMSILFLYVGTMLLLDKFRI